MARREQKVTVERHRLTLSNLDKVLYPETGTTKGEILDYCAKIAPHLIRHSRDRIATRKRWVDGVGTPDDPGDVFFERTCPNPLRRGSEHARSDIPPAPNDIPWSTILRR